MMSEFLEVILIAIALSVDAGICSIVHGKDYPKGPQRLRYALEFALAFGLFQFIMPLLGCFGGQLMLHIINDFAHLLACLLLLGVGINMIREGFTIDTEEPRGINLILVFALAIATSIDALAVGFSRGLTEATIWGPAIIIGLICFTISLACFLAGSMIFSYLKLKWLANLLGGGTLILLGLLIWLRK